MSKRLPYFQFEPAEWLSGSITLCSYEAQGIYVNIIAIYWQKDCDLDYEKIAKKFNNCDAFLELISDGIIKINGEKIAIDFLNKEFEKATKYHEKQQINGQKGGRPKKTNNPKKPSGFENNNPNGTQTKPIREDNIREDNIREDNIREDKKVIITNLVGKKIIDSSPFGDGELHFLCIEYSKKNIDKYPKEFYQSFLEYWTGIVQFGAQKGKELWRTEKTFTLGGRLATSFKITWQNSPNIHKTNQTPKIGKLQANIEAADRAAENIKQRLGL